MSTVTIHGVELEYNALDADTAERTEQAVKTVQERISELQQNPSTSFATEIRKACHTIFECFNTIFGNGTDKKLFGEKCDLGDCMEAFAELYKQTSESGIQRVQTIVNKYTPNRDTRRDATKRVKK